MSRGLLFCWKMYTPFYIILNRCYSIKTHFGISIIYVYKGRASPSFFFVYQEMLYGQKISFKVKLKTIGFKFPV